MWGVEEKKLCRVPRIWAEVDMWMKPSRESRSERGRDRGNGVGGGGEGGRIL